MAKKKKLKAPSKKKKKPRKPRQPQPYTGHMSDMLKRITKLEREVAELKGLKKGIVKWYGHADETAH